eukprot:COSAG01_NODE_1025_length_12057_cov_4.494105_7_plen_84_part_00
MRIQLSMFFADLTEIQGSDSAQPASQQPASQRSGFPSSSQPAATSQPAGQPPALTKELRWAGSFRKSQIPTALFQYEIESHYR